MKRLKLGNQSLYSQLSSKEWAVYAKRPFDSPKSVIEYLGRYTHKIAISNHRIRSIDQQQVSFRIRITGKMGGKKSCE